LPFFLVIFRGSEVTVRNFVVSVVFILVVATSLVTTQTRQSAVYEWAGLEAKATPIGFRRDVRRASTPTLEELEIHITTLNPGQVSHPPHQHPEEELLIVKEGNVEVLQNGVASRLGPGSVIFHASNELHNIRNVGKTPATYHVVQWRVAGKP
jgi:XRE family transcriptional regulator, regulator of sulfur utilization